MGGGGRLRTWAAIGGFVVAVAIAWIVLAGRRGHLAALDPATAAPERLAEYLAGGFAGRSAGDAEDFLVRTAAVLGKSDLQVRFFRRIEGMSDAEIARIQDNLFSYTRKSLAHQAAQYSRLAERADRRAFVARKVDALERIAAMFDAREPNEEVRQLADRLRKRVETPANSEAAERFLRDYLQSGDRDMIDAYLRDVATEVQSRAKERKKQAASATHPATLPAAKSGE